MIAAMSRARRTLRGPFASALFGGAIVAVFGWVAIAAGWIQSEGGSTTTVAAPLSAPVVDKSEGDSNVVNQIYKRDGDGVAFIESQMPARESQSFSPFGEPESEGGGTATGSGFVIDSEGHLLTNNHVVEGADRIQVKLGASDTTYGANVVGADPATDIALLKVNAPSDQLHPLPLGESSKLEVGDPVVAIGNPFGLDRTVTSGIVSALQRQIQAPNGFSISNVIQTDAAINPGNSGGPLIDAAGNVVGINSQIETGGGGSGNVGIGFAIPIDTARAEIKQLETTGKVEHAFLGVSLDPASNGAARLTEIRSGTPAEAAGLRAGDVITSFAGTKITSSDALSHLVDTKAPGDTVTVTFTRSGKSHTVKVTLASRPSEPS